MISNLKDLLALAESKGAAVPAFNCYNMETVMGVAQAARDTHAPVIFQLYTRAVSTEYGFYLAPVIQNAINYLPVPAVFHLDHGAGLPQVVKALRLGATSVMIDASTQVLEKNIEITKKAVSVCSDCGVYVEGELGHVGATVDEIVSDFTDVDEAVQFAQETGVVAMAVMVGSAHGVYKQLPVLNIQLIRDIHEATGLPLVLHGGSGVPDDQVRMAVAAGVRKMNFATDLVHIFLKSVYAKSPDIKAMDVFMKEPIEAIRQYAVNKIRLLGADTIL